jgi:ATP phosphoribosyltransferase regulatory subunit
MNDTANGGAARALLPAGLRDILPPDAAFEAAAVERLMEGFGQGGYERVKPPLIEFEDSLLSGPGVAMAAQSFRLMDPASGRMLALRPDMTPQIARIAATRLGHAARPLRLSYAGQVLRVIGSQLRPERQFGQAGIELIGSDQPEADAEVMLLAVEGLERLGVEGVSIDLTAPTLVPALAESLKMKPEDQRRLREALDHKDAAQVAALPGAAIFQALLKAGGPAAKALDALNAIAMPKAAQAALEQLTQVVKAVAAGAPAIALTIDPVENRNFEYHCGVTFTLFARGQSFELGRGGRYRVGGDCGGLGESAVGATLFLDTILRAAPGPKPKSRLFLPHGTPAATGRRWRAEGWITLAGLEDVSDPAAEARRLGCTHRLDGEKAVLL